MRFNQGALFSATQSFQPEMNTFCHFRTGRSTFNKFSANCTSLYKTANSARDQHVLSFPHWANHFLAIFSKTHEFVPNSVFSPRSARFVIFAQGTPLFNDFQQSARICTEQKFSARDRHVLSFPHWANHFLTIFSKVHEFVQKSVFSLRSARFLILGNGRATFL